MIYSEVFFLPISGWRGLHSVFPYSPYRLIRMRSAGGSGEKSFSGSISQMRQASVREACSSCWIKLLGPLLLASVDPLFEMEKYARSRDLRGEIYHPVETAFRYELKALYEKALPRNSDLTSIFRFPSDWANDRATFMIEELGRFGDEGSVLVIEPHVESPVLGRSAVNSIRSIRERLTSGKVPS